MRIVNCSAHAPRPGLVDPDLRQLPAPALEEVLNFARQICAALEHAHGNGVIHRDLNAVLESGCHRRFLAQVCREKMRINLLHGNWLRAQALATEFGIDELARAGEWRHRREYDEQWERFGSAHVLLLEHQKLYGEARRVLALLRDRAREAGYVYRQIALEAALAQACWYAGEQTAAFESLNRGLALSRGHGYSRSIFDETPALTQIIAAAIKSQRLAYGLNPRYLCRFEDVLGERHFRTTHLVTMLLAETGEFLKDVIWHVFVDHAAAPQDVRFQAHGLRGNL